jgi:oxygen-independent coproporphyrinogen-3 oxidase
MNNNKRNSEPTGLYIHIPFCQAKCRYCGFYSEPLKNHNPGRLVSAIITEIQKSQKRCQEPFSLQYNRLKQQKEPLVQNKRCQEPFFQTVYIGGGSPSCLPEEQLLRLAGEINRQWPKMEEFTIEVNPGQVNKDVLSKLRKCGVNRLSIGAQSFNADELDFLGRRHSVTDISRAVGAAKEAGFENVGLDLIFAIPACGTGFQPVKARPGWPCHLSGNSKMESWKHSLRSAIDSGVQHISAYALTYEEGTPLQKAVAAGEVKPVDEEIDRRMYETAIDELEKAGFKQYEISNFARPGFECKHNLNYWANKPYIGVGPAAGSYWQGRRCLNIADITKYIEAIEKGADAIAESENLNPQQIACETAVLNLRRRRGIDLEDFKNSTGLDAIELFSEPINRYKKLGLIEAADGRLFLTREALPIADSILCDFSTV